MFSIRRWFRQRLSRVVSPGLESHSRCENSRGGRYARTDSLRRISMEGSPRRRTSKERWYTADAWRTREQDILPHRGYVNGVETIIHRGYASRWMYEFRWTGLLVRSIARKQRSRSRQQVVAYVYSEVYSPFHKNGDIFESRYLTKGRLRYCEYTVGENWREKRAWGDSTARNKSNVLNKKIPSEASFSRSAFENRHGIYVHLAVRIYTSWIEIRKSRMHRR